MKKVVLLVIVVMLSVSSFAQRTGHKYVKQINSVREDESHFSEASKTTGSGDTLMLSNISTIHPLVVYSTGADSGYLTGTNYWGDRAFAERFDYNSSDSSLMMIGIFAQFGGTVNAASTKSISFNVWRAGVPQYITSSMFYSGFPSDVLKSYIVPVTQLGIGNSVDTLKRFLFDTSTTVLPGSFFAGYTINYNFNSLAGDTIGLASSIDGDRTSPKTTIKVTITDIDTLVDTLINVQNATQWSDGTWHDNYTDNDSIFNDLAIYPIVIVSNPNGVKGITKNGLTFYGSYPNPAVNTANIKFSLEKRSDVTIQIMDMNGRVLNTIKQASLVQGEHTVPVDIATLPAGDYLYLIRTSTGDGVASKMTVVR